VGGCECASTLVTAFYEGPSQVLIVVERQQGICDAQLIGRRHKQRGIAELLGSAWYVGSYHVAVQRHQI
jgi:hypothetical protein